MGVIYCFGEKVHLPLLEGAALTLIAVVVDPQVHQRRCILGPRCCPGVVRLHK